MVELEGEEGEESKVRISPGTLKSPQAITPTMVRPSFLRIAKGRTKRGGKTGGEGVLLALACVRVK